MFTGIQTARCRLRCFKETDLPAFAVYRADPAVARFQSWTTYSYDDAMALYQDVTGKAFALTGQWYQIAIADRQTDALLGDLALHFVGSGVVEIGFTISPIYQRQGYAKEALDGLLAYIFDVLQAGKVVAVTDANNKPSIALLESTGFERAGPVRAVVFKGEACEELDYCCLREQWLLRTE